MTTPRPASPTSPTPGGYAPPIWEQNPTGDYGKLPPGWSLAHQTQNPAWTTSGYDTWWNNSLADTDQPWVKPLLDKYGEAFQAYQWESNVTNADDAAWAAGMDLRFPGWKAIAQASVHATGPGGGNTGASKAQQIEAAMAAIKNQAETLGLPMDDVTLRTLARTVVNDNWSGDQLTDHLLKDPTKVTLPGTYQATAEQVRQLAKRQLVSISDSTAQDWSRRMLSGEMSMDTVNTILNQQAAGEFGWAAGALKAGVTMHDILAPARDTIAQELEMAPEQVDLMDPKWRSMVQSTNTDGTKRAANLTEVVRSARKDTAWAGTNSAARLASTTAQMLRQIFEG